MFNSFVAAQNIEGDSLRRVFSSKLSSCIDSGYCVNMIVSNHLVLGSQLCCDLFAKDNSKECMIIHGQDTIQHIMKVLCDLFRQKDYVVRKSKIHMSFSTGSYVLLELVDRYSLFYLGFNKNGEITFIEKKKITIPSRFSHSNACDLNERK